MKKLLSIILALVLIMSVVPMGLFTLTASAATSGTTGDCTWSLNGTVLTISGNGKMGDYSYSSSAPWGTSITKVVVENGVTSIGSYAFYNCKSLTSITIPNSVTSIGYDAFMYCELLTSITIPDGVLSIGTNAFQYCSSLTSVTIGKGVTSINDGAFDGCTSLKSIVVDPSNPNYCSEDGVLFNKDKTELIQYPCSITKTSYTIPNSVTHIGDSAFKDCESLTNVIFPDNLTSIGDYAFFYCESLESVTIPDSVTRIGVAAFHGTAWYDDQPNESLVYIGKIVYGYKGYDRLDCPSSITIKEGTLVIADQAFILCDESLVTIIIPDSVKYIGSEAFYGLSSLKNVTIGNGVTHIGKGAFGNCSSLKTIIIPSSVTIIGGSAFFYCESLTSITIPDSVTTIGYGAFNMCTSLKNVTIGKGVTSIGEYAFQYCDSLTSFTVAKENPVYHSAGNCLIETATKILIKGCNTSVIPSDGSVTSIADYAFHRETSLTSITIPHSVTSIGMFAFRLCNSLTSVTIGKNVTTIGMFAFQGCSFTNITIPDSVTSIEKYAFTGCSSLETITIGKGITNIGTSAFNNCSSLTDVWYTGSEADRNNISIDASNEILTSATWHYNCCIESDTKEHVYDDDYDADCNECGATREVPSKVVIGDIEIGIMPDEKLPIKEIIEGTTKFILGWKNPDGSIYNGLTYIYGLIADYVETLMMTVKYQLGTDSNAIRYIASVDETERYESVGWVFSIKNTNPKKGSANVTEKKSKKVYNSILAGGNRKTAADIYGGANYSKYLYVFEITDIPEAAADSTIYVRPYVEMEDGTIVYGDVSAQTLNGLKTRSKKGATK